MTSFLMAKIRYFSFKEGSEKVNGMVIRVRPNASLEKRLSEITGASFSPRLTLYCLENGMEEIEYLVNITGNRARKKTFVAGLDRHGNFDVLKKPRVNSRIYLKEISAKVARDLKEEAESWDLQRGYFDGGIS